MVKAMRHIKSFFLFSFAGLILAQSPESSTKVTPIAILPLDANGVSRSEADILTERLRSAFVLDGRFQVVERSQMEAILAEQGFQQAGCTTNECLVQAGLMLGVNRMVGGSVGKIGSRYTLDVRLFDVESSEIIRAVPKNVYGTVDQLLDIMPTVVADLAGPETDSRGETETHPDDILLTRQDVDAGIQAVRDAMEIATETLNESLSNVNMPDGSTVLEAIKGSENTEYSRGRRAGREDARYGEVPLKWGGIPLGASLLSSVVKNAISGGLAGLVALYIQNEINGPPQISREQRDRIASESPEYQKGYRDGYVKERKEIRKKRGTLGLLYRNYDRRSAFIASQNIVRIVFPRA